MASLISPGVQLEIVNETFYDSSSPGSIPLIIIATATNKLSPSGTGIAPMTTAANVGKMFLATSQRELIQNYGNPLFYSSGGAPLHGDELNEYGLHAAYQFLGVSNRAFIIRANLNTAALLPSDTPPTGAPVGGTFWLDTSKTSFGVFQSNGGPVPGSAWTSRTVLIAAAANTTLATGVHVPKAAFGANGDFAVAVEDTNNFLFEKIAGAWLRVGSTAWKAAHPTTVRSVASPAALVIGNSFTVNGVTVTLTGTDVTQTAANIVTAAIPSVTATVSNNALVITNTAGGNLVIGAGTGPVLTTLGITAMTTVGVTYLMTNDVQYPAGSAMGSVWIKGYATNKGADWTVSRYDAVSGAFVRVAAPLYPFNSALADGNLAKDAAAIAALASTTGTVYVGYDAATGVMQLRRKAATQYESLVYQAAATAPVGVTPEGALWYSQDFKVDIMVSNGRDWQGYHNRYPGTDPEGAIIAGSAPVTQTTGGPLVDNDLWIDASKLEQYPRLYRYDGTAQVWRLVDVTDQTSPFGILFADARQDSGLAYTGQPTLPSYSYESVAMSDMLVSNCVDPDAPDPRTVPSGMLLFNTRYSTYNVKEWHADWFGAGQYDPHTNYTVSSYTVGDGNTSGGGFAFAPLSNTGRWITVSGKRANGAPLMGRRAVRHMIVKAMAAAVIANQEARSEIVSFNLLSAPGYPELVSELVDLNTEQRETAFIIADTPIRLTSQAQDIADWGSNSYNADSPSEDGLGAIGGGITAANEYVGVYYPWGLSTNYDGSEVMVPPSTMVLRTYAYNDQIAYPWFAPAGFTRGIVTNASAVGYLTDENEFRAVLLNQSTRDLLYSLRINPIAYIQNRGLVVYGQKTLAPVSSALDRVNVARLVNYLNVSLDRLAAPFLFTQNDDQTRNGLKSALQRYLTSLAGLQALDDFAVQCDRENNSDDRIARNELWADIAIRPIKAVEFIYLPIRLTIGSTSA